MSVRNVVGNYLREVRDRHPQRVDSEAQGRWFTEPYSRLIAALDAGHAVELNPLYVQAALRSARLPMPVLGGALWRLTTDNRLEPAPTR